MAIGESVPLTGSVPDRGWRPGDWWSAGFRVVLLLVLAAGAATAMASVRPAERPEADLTADLAAGQVTYLDYERSDHRVRWMTGWWRWRTTALASWIDNGEMPSAGDAQSDAALAWLHRQIDASGHPVPVRLRVGPEPSWWPMKVVWEPLQSATVAAWVGTFLIMLGRADHRYANRWAWFWLFTVGQVGVLLYLMMEPRPIWRPRSWLPRTDRAPARGWTGLLWAIVLSVAAGVVALGVAAI
jgi:hypothetical protein